MTVEMMTLGGQGRKCPRGLDARRRSWTGERSGRAGVVVEGGLHSDRTTTRDLGAAQALHRIGCTWLVGDRCRIIRTAQRYYSYKIRLQWLRSTVHRKFTADSIPLQSQPGGAQSGGNSICKSRTYLGKIGSFLLRNNRTVQSPFTRGVTSPGCPGSTHKH